MRAHSLSSSRWLAALGVAAMLTSRPGVAVEELVVYGPALRSVSAVPTAETLRQDMTAYVESLYAEHKARVDASLSQRRATEIRIAAAKIPTRG